MIFRELDPEELAEILVELPETCALNIIDRNPTSSRNEIGFALGVSREGARLILKHSIARFVFKIEAIARQKNVNVLTLLNNWRG